MIQVVEPKPKEGKTENCMICGSPLLYLDRAQPLDCAYCGKLENGYVRCLQGHYLCEACHNAGSMRMIGDIVFGTTSKDPVEISEIMMNHPKLPMLGCQHAYIIAGAFLAAIKNNHSGKVTDEDIQEAFRRIEKQAIGGYCGLTGVCGIVPAIGACFSVLLGSMCGKDIEQKKTMKAVTQVAKVIGDLTGPSCCKAYVRASLGEAIQFLEENLQITLPIHDSSVICTHSTKHPHGCRESKCPYFK